MHAFAADQRPDDIMTPIAKALAPDEVADTAAYYAGQSAPFPQLPAPDPALIARGQQLATTGDAAKHVQACNNCHGPGGTGEPQAIPYLAGQFSQYITAQLRAWQQGQRKNSADTMAVIAKQLDDRDIQAVSAYYQQVQVSDALPWPNRDTAPEFGANLGSQSTASPPGTGAAVTFTCTRVGVGDAPGRVPDPDPSIQDMLRGGDLKNRIGVIVANLRAQDIEPPLIVNFLVVAYCPVVAADTGLTTAQKMERIHLFAQQVTAIAFSDTQQQVRDVLVNVPLSPDLLRKVNDAARTARLSRESWLTQAIEKALQLEK
jgi:cytochrome c553